MLKRTLIEVSLWIQVLRRVFARHCDLQYMETVADKQIEIFPV